MATIFEYVISLKDRASAAFINVTKQINGANKAAEQLNETMKVLLSSVSVAAIGMKMANYARESVASYQEQSVAATKLAQVMRNTMNARKEEFDSIINLTDAQQKLGVISDEIQISGAQELGTYLTQSSTLKKLIPAMNDMVAQQYGLNASQEQAVNIASMMGKVMDGQVGALSRYGYKFSEAQEKILKSGTEAQRAAVLFDVVHSAVGNVNEALAQTPEGKLKNAANNADELKERLGKVLTEMRAVWLKVDEAKEKVIGGLISWIERHKGTILAIISVISSGISKFFNLIMIPIRWVRDGFGWLIQKVKEGDFVIGMITKTIAVFTAALILVRVWQLLAAGATIIWQLATRALNVELLFNSVTWIVAGIIALIASIVMVIKMFDGWGNAWDNLMTGLKFAWLAYTAAFKLQWLTVVDAFMTGVEAIQKAWYKVKSLWDEKGANEGLAKLQSNAAQRAAEKAAQKGMVEAYAKVSVNAFSNVVGEKGLHRNSWTAGGAFNKIKASLMPGMDASSIAGGGGGSTATKPSREAIATGGTKNTTINITIGKQVETLTVVSNNIKEGAMKIRDIIVDEMTRAAAMAGALAQ